MAEAKVLIVEDDRIVADDIQSSLQNLGHTVSAVVASGAEALVKAKEDNPDLVLMDIVLKGEMNGIEAADRIRSQFNIPVVYLTAYADEELVERAKLTEPFGYIIKPFEDRELKTAIEIGLYKHKMEKKLKESEEWLTTTVRSIGDALIATDTEGYVTLMNPVAESLTGWDQEEAMGKPLKDVFNIINEETRKEVENPVTKVIRDGTIVGLANHTILIAKDRAEIPIDDSGAPIRNERGEIIGVVLVFRDITERKQAEEELKKYSERLEEMVEKRTQELREAHEQLVRQEKLAVLGQLAGGVGHEMRNPLGAIRNAGYYLNMALKDPEPGVKDALGILEREVLTSERIISSLLDFARPEPPTRIKADINEVVQAALSRAPVPENVEMVSQLNETLPTVLADPDQLRQAFGNFMLNAIQAMPEGGRLVVKSEAPSSEWVNVSFTDTGVGIAEDALGKVFEPLFTTKAKGIGLGLALTKIIVEGNEGTIEVQSKVGKGTTFTVRLPAS